MQRKITVVFLKVTLVKIIFLKLPASALAKDKKVFPSSDDFVTYSLTDL